MPAGQPARAAKRSRLSARDSAKRTPAEVDCAAAFQSIARDCVAKLQAQRLRTIAGDAEALHQMRVAISRLRAVVAFFPGPTSDPAWPRLEKELAEVYAVLGNARDADVIAALAHRKRYRAWAARAGADAAAKDDELHRRVMKVLRSARFRRLMEGLSGWIEHGPWTDREAPAAYCQPRLERWRKRLIRKGRRLADMGAKPRHRLRLKAKRYRYVLEALSEIGPAGTRAMLRRMHKPAKQLQRALGDLRDLQRLRRIGAAVSRPPGYRKRKAQFLKAAAAALRDLAHAPPMT